MARKKNSWPPKNSPVQSREISLHFGTLSSGDVITVRGEGHTRFIFGKHVVNTATGVDWLECWETKSGNYRAFSTKCKWKKVKK